MDLGDLKLWGGWVGMAAISVVYFLFPARRKEIDSATKTLVDTLQNSVLALQENDRIKDEKIKELTEQQKENISEIKKAREEIKLIKEDRDTIKSILEARDENTLEFQKQCLESVKITNEIHGIIKTLISGLNENNTMTKEFMKMMREHFLNVENAAIQK